MRQLERGQRGAPGGAPPAARTRPGSVAAGNQSPSTGPPIRADAGNQAKWRRAPVLGCPHYRRSGAAAPASSAARSTMCSSLGRLGIVRHVARKLPRRREQIVPAPGAGVDLERASPSCTAIPGRRSAGEAACQGRRKLDRRTARRGGGVALAEGDVELSASPAASLRVATTDRRRRRPPRVSIEAEEKPLPRPGRAMPPTRTNEATSAGSNATRHRRGRGGAGAPSTAKRSRKAPGRPGRTAPSAAAAGTLSAGPGVTCSNAFTSSSTRTSDCGNCPLYEVALHGEVGGRAAAAAEAAVHSRGAGSTRRHRRQTAGSQRYRAFRRLPARLLPKLRSALARDDGTAATALFSTSLAPNAVAASRARQPEPLAAVPAPGGGATAA